MKKYSEKIVVRYAETDQMGIAHHSNYPIWFEAARTGFIRALGISYGQVEKRGLLLPLVELDIRYKRPSFYEDELQIHVHIEKVSAVKIIFGYEVVRGQKQCLAVGRTVHAFTDQNMKIIHIEKTHPDIFELFSG